MAKKATSKKTPATPATSRPRSADLHVWQIQAVRDVLVVAAVLGLVWAGYALRAVTVPLLVALLLAYLFEPVVERLSARRYMNRVRAVSAVLASVGLVVVLVLAIAVPLVVFQAERFVTDIRDGTMRSRVARLGEYVPANYTDEFDSLLRYLPGDVEPDSPEAHDAADAPATEARPAPPTTDEIEALIDRRLEERLGATDDPGGIPGTPSTWGGLLRGGTHAVVRAVGSVVQVALVAFLVPFYFFFFSLWYHDVMEFLRRFIPEKNRDRWLELLGRMDGVVAGFVRGRIVISLIVGVLLAIGWFLCGVPYAIGVGIVIGIFFIVPYLGGVGVPLAVGLLAIEYAGTPVADRAIWLGWWGVVLWPTLWFGVVQIIESYALTPAIAGKATNLDPVTIIVAVLAGGSVLGVYGMLLAIPLAACGKILCTDLLMPRIQAWTRGEARDPLPIGGGE
ncbi:MAG: AI-2E family transporter [Planctomycetota bacterium]|jgi:predicted PurR-regulated permease PerM